jgi:hypothetical protein
LVHVARPRLTDPARVVGAKPAAFAGWLFELLGALPGDQLDDLFPGSGGIARAWALYASRGSARGVAEDVGDESRLDPDQAVAEDLGDASWVATPDACAIARDDVSPLEVCLEVSRGYREASDDGWPVALSAPSSSAAAPAAQQDG